MTPYEREKVADVLRRGEEALGVLRGMLANYDKVLSDQTSLKHQCEGRTMLAVVAGYYGAEVSEVVRKGKSERFALIRRVFAHLFTERFPAHWRAAGGFVNRAPDSIRWQVRRIKADMEAFPEFSIEVEQIKNAVDKALEPNPE